MGERISPLSNIHIHTLVRETVRITNSRILQPPQLNSTQSGGSRCAVRSTFDNKNKNSSQSASDLPDEQPTNGIHSFRAWIAFHPDGIRSLFFFFSNSTWPTGIFGAARLRVSQSKAVREFLFASSLNTSGGLIGPHVDGLWISIR